MLSSPSCRAIYIIEPALRSFPTYLILSTPTHRFQSTKSITPATAPPTRIPTVNPALSLNPPPSTRPPPLHLPSRLPNQAAYKYYFSIGKTYANFYKTGFKNLYHNFHAAKAIAQRLESTTYEEDVRKGLISRAEWLLAKRQRADLLRVPLFILVFIVCGEFTPLVAIFFSGAVPRSLWVPRQVLKAREKVEARRREVFRNPPEGLKIEDTKEESHTLSKAQIIHIGRSLGLYSSLWDRINLPPLWLIRRGIKKRMDSVELDDFAIRRDGGVEKMEPAEVELAVEIRGLDILGKEEQELRRSLRQWLLNRKFLAGKGLSVKRLYLARPSVWPCRD